MKKIIFGAALIAAITLSMCGFTSGGVSALTLKEPSNTAKVSALLKSIETNDIKPIAYINANKYIQHNLSVEDGLAGFGKLLKTLPKKSAKVDTVRTFQDGDFVVAQTKYNFFGPKAGFDIFRFENGKIVEHWDNLQTISGPNPSKHTMFDGTTKITDVDKTKTNKNLVKNFVQDVLMGKNPGHISGYFKGNKYIQHNPGIADGLTGLNTALKSMAAKGITMKYDKLHMVLGQGNFVLTVSEGTLGGKSTAFYDLFRVEKNKIAEHWDVIENILPKAQWKNNNGKFKENLKMNNTQKVVDLLKSIETGAAEPVGYINPEKYIQHNLGAEDGLAGFGKLLAALPKGSAKVNTIRAFEDGDYVVAQTEYHFFGPKAGFDIFRFEDGRIVEHWDNLQEIAGPNPSGHTMFDGTTSFNDLDKTTANKELVKSFVQDVLMGSNPGKLTNYFDGDNYIQHNPAIADGLSGLGAALKGMAEQGIEMKYDEIHMVLGNGNFVLTVSEGSFAGKHTSFYDLFRVKDGKIAEHWDVMETILSKDQWKNQNGKY